MSGARVVVRDITCVGLPGESGEQMGADDLKIGMAALLRLERTDRQGEIVLGAVFEFSE